MNPAARVGGDALRLFLALRLPARALDELERWGERELSPNGRGTGDPSVRQISRDHLHVTLAFLGARPAAELPAIVEALGAVAEYEAPPLVPVGYRETRSVGMVVLDDPSGRARQLAGDLHRRLEQIGVYQRETRPWLAHVTVVRFRTRPRLQPSVADLTRSLGSFVPSDAAAFLSRLHPTGARYEVLETVGWKRTENG